MGFKSRSATFPIVLILALLWVPLPAQAASYLVSFLTSDQTGTAPVIDPNLQNPWGLSYSATGPFWAADEHSGVSTLYDGTGAPQSLIVTIPHVSGHSKGTPTGTPA